MRSLPCPSEDTRLRSGCVFGPLYPSTSALEMVPTRKAEPGSQEHFPLPVWFKHLERRHTGVAQTLPPHPAKESALHLGPKLPERGGTWSTVQEGIMEEETPHGD